MNRHHIVNHIYSIICRQCGSCPPLEENSQLRQLGFRSLDFAELCLRVEQELGRELNLGAGLIRRIETVADVCDVLQEVGASPVQ